MVARALLGVVLLSVCSGCGHDATQAQVALRHHTVEGKLRPDAPNNQEMFRYNAGDVVETHDSPGGRFKIHFTRAGRHAVPAADLNQDGVPDAVASVAVVYDAVSAFYEDNLGFRAPRSDVATASGNGGDGRFDVYLLDFGLSADGVFRQEACDPQNPSVCAGYMVQENDFAGYGYPSVDAANRVLSSHEFFHAVQAAYDTELGSVLAEGTAVWATERFDPTLTDLEGFVHGYLENPDRSLDKPLPGPVDPFSYGSALFFQFLDESHGNHVIRHLWESAVNGANGVSNPTFLQAVESALSLHHGSSFAAAFTQFASWNLYTGTFANPSMSYARGASYPRVRVDDATAPLSLPLLRVFYASAQYRAVPPLGRSTMTARLATATATPQELVGVRLALSVRRGRTLSAPVVVEGGEVVPPLDVSGADALITVVINVETGGSSKRPGLCVGTEDEVATCAAAMSGAADAGSGAVDAGSAAPGADGGAAESGGDEGGGPALCGCARARVAGGGWGAVLLAGVLLRRRRCA